MRPRVSVVVVIQMATGQLPFRADTSGMIFHAILESPPVPPVRINPEVPPKLVPVLFADVIYGADVRMIKRRRGLRLALEPRESMRISAYVLR